MHGPYHVFTCPHLSITVYSDVSPKILFDDLQALQELSVVSQNYTLLSISPQISRLSTLRTLKLDRGYNTTLDLNFLYRLDPVWAHLTNVAIISSEQHVVVRLLQLAPNLSSLSICKLHNHDKCPLESLTHTNIQSLSATFCGYYGQSGITQRDVLLVPFLNALTLPNLHVLNIDDRSWQHEELTAVGSGTVGFVIGLEQN